MINTMLVSLFLLQSGISPSAEISSDKPTLEDYKIIGIVAIDLLKNKEYTKNFGPLKPEQKPKDPHIWIDTMALQMFPHMSEANNADFTRDIDALRDKFTISDEIRLSFAKRNDRQFSLADFQSKDRRVSLSPPLPWLDNVSFKYKYPNTGSLGLWLPGFAKDGKQALFRFVARPSSHGIDGAYMLRKAGDKWKIQWRYLRIR